MAALIMTQTCKTRKEEASKLREEAALKFTERKLNKAKELYSQSLDLDPDHEASLFMLGKIDFYNRDFPSAEKNFEAVVDEDECHSAGSYWLYKIKGLKAEERKTAIEKLSGLAKKLPNRWEVVYTLGTMLEEEGRIAEAIQLYQEAVNEETKLSLIYMRLGRIYEKADMKKMAERYNKKMEQYKERQ
ncbi:hypothetical protein LPTSP3_g07570 [Leptospira kobayashii]|uniref:Tetratricopeptide repeat protein n=2 Tax=Leptospira kobayashii TaxID=1917830 RepID=A0ABN6KA29_9LEPT|nr:hypothetical protein LPTSP3_g07570 [Leptospira kobayashii]